MKRKAAISYRRRVRRRLPGKRPRSVRYLRTPRQASMMLKRTFWSQNWTLSTASTAGFWKYFGTNLSSIPNYAELTTLFDQYKICGVKYTFRPRFDNFAGNDSTTNLTSKPGNYVHIVNDPRSVVQPSGTYTSATLNNFLEQGGVRSYSGNRTFSVYFKPTIDVPANGNIGAIRRAAPWLQTTETGCVHNGFHAFFQDVNMTGVTNQSFDVFVTVYMMVRGAR